MRSFRNLAVALLFVSAAVVTMTWPTSARGACSGVTLPCYGAWCDMDNPPNITVRWRTIDLFDRIEGFDLYRGVRNGSGDCDWTWLTDVADAAACGYQTGSEWTDAYATSNVPTIYKLIVRCDDGYQEYRILPAHLCGSDCYSEPCPDCYECSGSYNYLCDNDSCPGGADWCSFSN